MLVKFTVRKYYENVFQKLDSLQETEFLRKTQTTETNSGTNWRSEKTGWLIFKSWVCHKNTKKISSQNRLLVNSTGQLKNQEISWWFSG